MMLRLVIALLFILATTMPAGATSTEEKPKPDFSFKGSVACTQIESSGATSIMPQLALEVDGKKARLHGKLDVPTPGYNAELKNLQGESKNFSGTLVLREPEGMALQVVQSLPIDLSFELVPQVRFLTLTVEKPFSWGPQQIICMFGVL